MIEQYVALADLGSVKLDTDNKQIEIDKLLITCDTDGAFVTIADNNDLPKSYKIFLAVGLNPVKYPMVFNSGKDVTITASGGNVTIFYRYNHK